MPYRQITIDNTTIDFLYARRNQCTRLYVKMYSDNLISELRNSAHSCSQRGPATAWLTSERLAMLHLF